MAQGRCAGCGETNASCKVMKNHILQCPKYLELFRSQPSRALDPTAEYERWQQEENDPESRAIAKDERLAVRFAELDAKRADQAARWQRPKDILDD